jgi:hypothetical protein
MSLDASAAEMTSRLRHEPSPRALDSGEPGAAYRPVGRKLQNNLDGPGAHRLAEIIHDYWLRQGVNVVVKISEGIARWLKHRLLT